MPRGKKLLVVDANIISHALTKSHTVAYTKLFQDLERDHRFIVSGFTRFELQRSSDKENREKIATYINDDMTDIDLSRKLMDFASRVYYLYSKHRLTKGLKISDGDIINAALAIIQDCPILTADSLDYPAPFFKEISRMSVKYQSSKNRENVDMVYILEPDMEHIKHCFGEHIA